MGYQSINQSIFPPLSNYHRNRSKRVYVCVSACSDVVLWKEHLLSFLHGPHDVAAEAEDAEEGGGGRHSAA